MTLNLKNLFDAKFYGAWKISDPRAVTAVTFSIWHLKTSLGQFESKAFGKGLSSH